MAAGEPLNLQPATATDTSKVGASDHNALGRKTNLHIREDLATQMWHRSLLRKKASAAWLHLGHTDKKSKDKNKNKNLHRKNLEAKAWAEATANTRYSRATQSRKAQSMARDIQAEDRFRFKVGKDAVKISAIILPILLTLSTSAALDLAPRTADWHGQQYHSAMTEQHHSEVGTPLALPASADTPTHNAAEPQASQHPCTAPSTQPSNNVKVRVRTTNTSPALTPTIAAPLVTWPLLTPTIAAPLGCHQGAQAEGSQVDKMAVHQKQCRDAHWDLVHDATSSADYKEFTKCKTWRRAISQVHSDLLHAVDEEGDQLAEVTDLIRSAHPGRALPGTNPTRLAFALQPAVEQGLLTQQQADSLIGIAAHGIQAEDFRTLEGEALDLSTGNTELPEDEELLLDFYYAQCGAGRVLCFPETDAEYLNRLGSVVLSPSFLHRATGKKPRPILNLSSTGYGVNQRMDDLDADHDGYTTIPKVAPDIITTYIDMVQNPAKYNIEDINDIDLSMFVADASDAFFSVPVSARLVGMQCTRVAGITIVPMCCSFGWRRSAEVFSHITASIMAVQKSDLTEVSFTAPNVKQRQLTGKLARFTEDKIPAHANKVKGHVDDYVIFECSHDDRQTGAAQDLVFAIKAHLGQHSVSAKKYLESSFWTDLQKVIGAWFDTHNFTVTMPCEKIQEAIDILESGHFAPTATEFEIDLCATLRGKLRWALYATKIGDYAALINIERQRTPGKTNARKVRPRRHHGETQEMATRKFHNDMLVYKHMLYACRERRC